jgi:hypothetical protein
VDGLAHNVLPTVIEILADGDHVLMVGPAGTGKSHIAHQAADALGMEFYSISLTAATPPSMITGYMDADLRDSALIGCRGHDYFFVALSCDFLVDRWPVRGWSVHPMGAGAWLASSGIGRLELLRRGDRRRDRPGGRRAPRFGEITGYHTI